jgi:hypothetical protein
MLTEGEMLGWRAKGLGNGNNGFRQNVVEEIDEREWSWKDSDGGSMPACHQKNRCQWQLANGWPQGAADRTKPSSRLRMCESMATLDV